MGPLSQPLVCDESLSHLSQRITSNTVLENDDDVVRRDSLHAIINSLPDPNYATLRALALHLYRVMDNSSVNRMSSQNLAIVFGPTLLGTAPNSSITDAGWQVRVIDTILQNTYQIFDDD
jgi:hypothetical protein